MTQLTAPAATTADRVANKPLTRSITVWLAVSGGISAAVAFIPDLVSLIHQGTPLLPAPWQSFFLRLAVVLGAFADFWNRVTIKRAAKEAGGG